MKRLFILEGPDGGGKTTLGNELSARLEVPVTKHGPYLEENQIWKHYLDSMLPAFSDERDVILDRCWLAEPIYGEVMRGGVNRVEKWQERILQYVAIESNAKVILCMPPLDRCMAAFNSRRDKEYPDSGEKMAKIYDGYTHLWNTMYWALPFLYDYTRPDHAMELKKRLGVA